MVVARLLLASIADIKRQAGPVGSVANDPSATLELHCGNASDFGFGPLAKCSLEPIRCVVVRFGSEHEAARVHYAC